MSEFVMLKIVLTLSTNLIPIFILDDKKFDVDMLRLC